jgi:uncharacterized membrane-anchored protein
MIRKSGVGLLLSLILTIGFANPIFAESELKINWIEGPKLVDIGSDIAQVNLPEDYIFANGDDAKKIMEYLGNPPTGQEEGIIYPKNEQEDWFVLFEYNPLGFVRDDESKNLNADKILESIKKGNEEANKERKKMDVPPLDIIGWEEAPHYDSKTHNLVWSIMGESEGYKIINYNMRILGRHGIMSVTLVADPEEMSIVKNDLEKIISNFSYKEGKRYSDYVPGKDKAAEIGLTALIAGGAGAAATKAGLLAKFLLIFKKAWVILAAGIVAIFSKLKGIRKKPHSETVDSNNPETTNIEATNIETTNIEATNTETTNTGSTNSESVNKNESIMEQN